MEIKGLIRKMEHMSGIGNWCQLSSLRFIWDNAKYLKQCEEQRRLHIMTWVTRIKEHSKALYKYIQSKRTAKEKKWFLTGNIRKVFVWRKGIYVSPE